MDEKLGYSDEEVEERRLSSSEWQLTHDSLLSLERESSSLFLQYRNYHLHLIQKKEIPSDRRIIPSTKYERFSYLRNYVSSPIKTQIVCMYQKSFNVFFWEYVMNSVFKSLQHTFVTIFLASYVPEEHFFLSKMVPFMHGLKYCFIITGLLEVIAYSWNILILFDYLLGSIFSKNPWNRCPEKGYPTTINGDIVYVNCYNVLDFGNRVKNRTVVFYKQYYYLPQEKIFLQLVQIEHYRHNILTMSTSLMVFYTIVIWVIIGSSYNQIFKKNFWKIFNHVHLCVVAIDFLSFAYLIFYAPDNTELQSIQTLPSWYAYAFSLADVDFLAESTTAPPVVHLLTARSTQEILPGRDSALITLSNALCFIFRALLAYKIKGHCEALVRVPIIMPGFIANAWLYFWPMFFSTFFLGDIYTLIFLSLHFAMEIMTAIVTFQCLVEAIVSEWPRIHSLIATNVFIITGIITNICKRSSIVLILAYNKSTATLIEVLVMYLMYPVYRLVDDMTFHYGSPIHWQRVNLLTLVPIYCLSKYYGIIESIRLLLRTEERKIIVTALIWSYSLILIPLMLGILYCVYKYVWFGRRNWSRMFAPSEDWGPRDYNTRQLRKMFDLRTYNSSQAPRNLSRHILGRADSKAYRLDIRYDTNRRSTVLNVDFKSENEKKF